MALTTTAGSAYFLLLVQNDDNNVKYKFVYLKAVAPNDKI